MKKRYIFAILIAVIGLLLFFTPFGIAQVCDKVMDNGKPMKCYWMGETIRMLGVAIVLIGVLMLIFARFAQGLAISSIVMGVCSICLAWFVVGTCSSPTMPCNVYTRPTITILSALLIVVSLVYVAVTWKEK